MSAHPTLPGLAHPVDDAQTVFRAALSALSRPGLAVALPTLAPPLPGSAVCPGLLALALTLCDSDTPLWLDAAADTPQVRHHLRFHCAARFAPDASQAAFALIARPEQMPRLDVFNQGSADFPDRSATLLISANLSEAHGPAYELTGPGVQGNQHGGWQSFHASDLPAWFVEDWAANHAAYPLGVDIVLVDAGAPPARLLGLPRTARVREATVCM